MHREIRDHIENVLAGSEPEHLAGCEECRSEVEGMQEHTALLRELRAPENIVAEPRAGFYARVMERIEAEGPISIWNLFIESAFGRRIAVASMALAILLGVYLVTSERAADDPMIAVQEAQQQQLVVVGEDGPARVIMQMDQSPEGQSSEDAVLADLVTYQEQ
jgi:anti-sigma-K factor RskA